MWKQNVYDLGKHTGQINTHYLDALLMRTAIDHFFYEEQSREFWLNLWASSHKYTFFVHEYPLDVDVMSKVNSILNF